MCTRTLLLKSISDGDIRTVASIPDFLFLGPALCSGNLECVFHGTSLLAADLN